jgi:hypothetical protein
LVSPKASDVRFESYPPGASVVTNGVVIGHTPCVLIVPMPLPSVSLHLDGYHEQLVDVGLMPDPWLFGNVVTLGLGLVVDGALGNSSRPDDEPIVVYLRPCGLPAPDPWTRTREAVPTSVDAAPGVSNFAEGLIRLLAGRHMGPR